jgi:excisionase family DNA binding protein
MSSNITIQRICQYCGNSFTAKKTTTKFCSHKCNSRGYKLNLKNKKIEISHIETTKIIDKPIEDLKSREVLSVPQVATILGLSKKAVYNMVNDGRLKASNLGERLIRIRRIDLDNLLIQDFIPIVKTLEPTTEPIKFIESEWYGLAEIIERYNISDSAIRTIAKREGIPREQKGKFVFYRKKEIDQVFSKPPRNSISDNGQK